MTMARVALRGTTEGDIKKWAALIERAGIPKQ
jgi:hypothetical protein